MRSRPFATAGNNVAMQYDVTADGKRFLIISINEGTAVETPISVVVNWRK